VIKETIKKDLPPGFQRSEFLLEHGFLDFIVDRKELKQKLSEVAFMFRS
jgi:acetyl-CoA carboxylase carboxyl transferase subunit beta